MSQKSQSNITFGYKCVKNGLSGFKINDTIIYNGKLRESTLLCEYCNYPVTRSAQAFNNGNVRCPICSGGIVKTEDEWFTKHHYNDSDILDLIDFSKFIFINMTTKSAAKCKICDHIWNTTLCILDTGHLCPKCGRRKQIKSQTKPLDTFILDAVSVHDDKYSYHDTIYLNDTDLVKIWCNSCEIFFHQTRSNHLRGHGCKKCVTKVVTSLRVKTIEQFIKDAIEIHGDRYSYIEVIYINSNTHIKIWCNSCKKYFHQSPHNHINGKCGCPICNESKGEKETVKWLEYHGFKYEQQKVYDNLLGVSGVINLRIDFYLPNYNTCIEYDGEQHYKWKRGMMTKQEFLTIQEHDRRKTQYCIDNGIRLIRIRWDESIDELLTNTLI